MKTPRTRALLGLVLVAGALVAMAFSGDLRQRAVLFILLYVTAVAGYLLLLSAPTGLRLRIVLVVALAVRLAFLPSTPSLSNDYHRYIWDGRVQAQGVNPYLYAPSNPRLDGVARQDRDTAGHRNAVNHAGLQTVYPPLAEAMFAGVAAAGGGLLALKIVFGIGELLTAVAVAWLAGLSGRRRGTGLAHPAAGADQRRTARAGADPRGAASASADDRCTTGASASRRRSAALTLYLLCPLVVLETWSSVHVETLAVLFVVLAAALIASRRDPAATPVITGHDAATAPHATTSAPALDPPQSASQAPTILPGISGDGGGRGSAGTGSATRGAATGSALRAWIASPVLRDAAAGAALGLAAALKVTPALLIVPALIGKRVRPLVFLPAVALAWGLPYVPYLLTGDATGSLGSWWEHGNALVFFLISQVLPYTAAAIVCAVIAIGGAAATAAAFAWTATLLILVMPVVHPWYWLTPVALALATGLRMPVYLGLAAPLGEIAWATWPRFRGWLHLVTYAPLLAGIPALASRLCRRHARR
jgi:hypothetical protein